MNSYFIITAGMFIVLNGILILSYLKYRSKTQTLLENHAFPFQSKSFLFIGLYIEEKMRLLHYFPGVTAKIHQKIMMFYGKRDATLYTKFFIYDALTVSYLVCYGSVSIALLILGDLSILLLGFLVAIACPLLLFRKLDKQIQFRQRQILIDLPELLNQLILLVNAGETVVQAIIRCSKMLERNQDSFLYREFLIVIQELQVNSSLSTAIENLNQRAAYAEIHLFSSAILINYRKGGSEFVHALQSISHEYWHKRKSVTRTLGEEASSKLLFPMILIFIVVMIIVASPGILMMSNQ